MTEHIGIKYHHSRDIVRRGEIKVLAVDTKELMTDISTKVLDLNMCEYMRWKLIGW